jgi:hypothetical protein
VVETAEGVRYRLDDGTEHRSPSSAGKAVTGGACNGWVFWSVEGTEKPKRETKATAERLVKEKEPAAKKKAVRKKSAKAKSTRKGKSARMASAESYGCGVCPETFPTMKKATKHALTHTS